MNKSGANEKHRDAHGLSQALEFWVKQGQWKELERWLDREVDREGTPIRLSIPEWSDCLGALFEARRQRPGWPESLDERTRALLRAVLRFSRTDGTLCTQFNGAITPGAIETLEVMAKAFPRSGEARVLGWWLCLPRPARVPPPLPAWSSDRHPLAALRASWQKQDDLLVLDHRQRGTATRMELIGSGHSWLGPDWTSTSTSPSAQATAPKPHHWVSTSTADLAEWTFRCSGLTVTRSALLLRGRQTAIFSEQMAGRTAITTPIASMYALPPGVSAEPLPGCRGMLLRPAGKRATAQVLPLALPCLPYETERGEFGGRGDGGGLSLSVMPRGRRAWLPLLVSWNPERNRKKLSWRILTVSERSKICPPDQAFAVRVSWGRDDTLVIYRSLGAPARRAFLGHLTTARFLVGKFTAEGAVEPILSVD
jgi:hypothetical protein